MLFLLYFILLILNENEKVFFTAAQPVMSDPSNQRKKPTNPQSLCRFEIKKKREKIKEKRERNQFMLSQPI